MESWGVPDRTCALLGVANGSYDRSGSGVWGYLQMQVLYWLFAGLPADRGDVVRKGTEREPTIWVRPGKLFTK